MRNGTIDPEEEEDLLTSRLQKCWGLLSVGDRWMDG